MLTLLLAALSAPPAVGDTVSDFTLQSVAGEEVTLSDVREAGPVVLVVLRGFPGYQCPLCSRQFGQFVAKADQFAERDASLIFVYPADASLGADGTRQKAKEFLRNATLPENVHVVLDPGYSFTDAYDLRWDAPRETAFPSTFVIDSSGVVRNATVSKSHGGRTSVAEILAAVADVPQPAAN